jgi:hypothetical protein
MLCSWLSPPDDVPHHIGQIGQIAVHTTAIESIAEDNEDLFEKPGNALLSPGDFVRHPERPDWGLGQIQSMIGHRITVNFENAGKLVIDGNVVELAPAPDAPGGSPRG